MTEVLEQGKQSEIQRTCPFCSKVLKNGKAKAGHIAAVHYPSLKFLGSQGRFRKELGVAKEAQKLSAMAKLGLYIKEKPSPKPHRGHPITPEIRAKISQANKRKPDAFCLVCGNKLSYQQKYCSSTCYHKTRRKILDRDLLYDLYEKRRFSTGQIAEYLKLPKTRTGRELVAANLRRYGIPLRKRAEAIAIRNQEYTYSHNPRKGDKHPQWKGGRRISGGYVLVLAPNHPRACNGYAYEHILIWEQSHNKPLPENWVVHHLDGDKLNNSPDNLMALPDRKHKRVLKAKAGRIMILEKRVTQLEAEITLLKKALEANQAIFYIGEG